ncbi:MAG: succinate dehydrogenase, cytochrome b556 subunit [Actinomycetota bacterium]|nr:succinate dehydrogenase, cytochrome b556 subunit [Actinomycetota bacterium]
MSTRSTVYKGKTGQWAFVLHRISGFLILMFILLHIIDISTINFPSVYASIHRLYGNVLMRTFEVGLLFGLTYHALNGLRVIMIDFFPGVIKNEKRLFVAMLSLSLLLTVVGGVIILKPFFTGKV